MKNLITSLVVSALSGATFADTWTVDDDGKADFDNIQAAIDAASDGDYILISAGTYFESDLFIEKPDISIIGEVHADGTPSVIIDGSKSKSGVLLGIGVAAATGANVQNIHFTGSSEGNALWIYHHNPTITNCLFTDNNADVQGAAVWGSDSEAVFQSCTFTNNHSSSGSALFFKSIFDEAGPTIRDCIFEDNSGSSAVQIQDCNPLFDQCTFENNTGNNGAGMYNYNCSPTLTDCTFTNNTAVEGGGMYNDSSSPTLTDCAFVSNESVWGGGVRNNSSSSPSLANCIFTNNISTEGGGGMHNSLSSHPSLSECVFTKNTAQGGKYEDGGGMRNFNSSPTLINCSFEGNIAGDGGGGMYNMNGSNPSLTNCTFDSNIAEFNGGGIRNYNSSPILENCTLTFNSASIGGGMRNYESSPMLTDTTVCGNTPDQIDGNWINNGGNTIANECPIYCPDINGDGFVNVVELLTVIDQWGLTDSPADLNFDGIVDVSDLLIVVGNWGPCE